MRVHKPRQRETRGADCLQHMARGVLHFPSLALMYYLPRAHLGYTGDTTRTGYGPTCCMSERFQNKHPDRSSDAYPCDTLNTVLCLKHPLLTH